MSRIVFGAFIYYYNVCPKRCSGSLFIINVSVPKGTLSSEAFFFLAARTKSVRWTSPPTKQERPPNGRQGGRATSCSGMFFMHAFLLMLFFFMRLPFSRCAVCNSYKLLAENIQTATVCQSPNFDTLQWRGRGTKGTRSEGTRSEGGWREQGRSWRRGKHEEVSLLANSFPPYAQLLLMFGLFS